MALTTFFGVLGGEEWGVMGEVVTVGAQRLPVWPEGREITALDDEGTVPRTRFADIGDDHPALAAKTLELAERPEFARQSARASVV